MLYLRPATQNMCACHSCDHQVVRMSQPQQNYDFLSTFIRWETTWDMDIFSWMVWFWWYWLDFDHVHIKVWPNFWFVKTKILWLIFADLLFKISFLLTTSMAQSFHLCKHSFYSKFGCSLYSKLKADVSVNTQHLIQIK